SIGSPSSGGSDEDVLNRAVRVEVKKCLAVDPESVVFSAASLDGTSFVKNSTLSVVGRISDDKISAVSSEEYDSMIDDTSVSLPNFGVVDFSSAADVAELSCFEPPDDVSAMTNDTCWVTGGLSDYQRVFASSFFELPEDASAMTDNTCWKLTPVHPRLPFEPDDISEMTDGTLKTTAVHPDLNRTWAHRRLGRTIEAKHRRVELEAFLSEKEAEEEAAAVKTCSEEREREAKLDAGRNRSPPLNRSPPPAAESAADIKREKETLVNEIKSKDKQIKSFKEDFPVLKYFSARGGTEERKWDCCDRSRSVTSGDVNMEVEVDSLHRHMGLSYDDFRAQVEANFKAEEEVEKARIRAQHYADLLKEEKEALVDIVKSRDDEIKSLKSLVEEIYTVKLRRRPWFATPRIAQPHDMAPSFQGSDRAVRFTGSCSSIDSSDWIRARHDMAPSGSDWAVRFTGSCSSIDSSELSERIRARHKCVTEDKVRGLKGTIKALRKQWRQTVYEEMALCEVAYASNGIGFLRDKILILKSNREQLQEVLNLAREELNEVTYCADEPKSWLNRKRASIEEGGRELLNLRSEVESKQYLQDTVDTAKYFRLKADVQNLIIEKDQESIRLQQLLVIKSNLLSQMETLRYCRQG
ncbi:hypothetical protein THAOC_35434, partial [Thalassiosira oceanica]